MQTKAQKLQHLLTNLIGTDKTNEVFDILIDKIEKNPNSIKPKLLNFKMFANFL